MIKEILYVFLVSMVPVLELRGAIPLGVALGLPWYLCIPAAIIGNLVPVPFILFGVEWFLEKLKNIRFLGLDRFAMWLERKVEKNKGKITKYATFGLMLFIGIPLPGTGAWTGTMVAAFIKMKPRHGIISAIGGVIMASIIVGLISYGVLGFLSFLL